MIYRLNNSGHTSPSLVVSLRCPSCRQRGTLESLNGANDVTLGSLRLGQRRCPNPDCHAHVFVVADQPSRDVQVSYPAERIDFDSSGIPEPVVEALEESITCHANQCFTAGAIMVRKTLEELCDDQGAEGENLKARIKDLGTKVTLPTELLEGLDDLRLLGNDAAHIEARAYDAVGQEEVEVGIMFAKEVLKATYQYKTLLGRLKKLKKGSE